MGWGVVASKGTGNKKFGHGFRAESRALAETLSLYSDCLRAVIFHMIRGISSSEEQKSTLV